jgi:hypothetical protein
MAIERSHLESRPQGSSANSWAAGRGSFGLWPRPSSIISCRSIELMTMPPARSIVRQPSRPAVHERGRLGQSQTVFDGGESKLKKWGEKKSTDASAPCGKGDTMQQNCRVARKGVAGSGRRVDAVVCAVAISCRPIMPGLLRAARSRKTKPIIAAGAQSPLLGRSRPTVAAPLPNRR